MRCPTAQSPGAAERKWELHERQWKAQHFPGRSIGPRPRYVLGPCNACAVTRVGMHLEAFHRCETSCLRLQGVHRRAVALTVRTAFQTHAPLQVGRADARVEQKVRMRSGIVVSLSQKVSASSSRRSSKQSFADQTLPVTPEVPDLPPYQLISALSFVLIMKGCEERATVTRAARHRSVLCLQVVLLAVPVLIVAIPWALGHVQLCLAVCAVIALSPFGTVIWTLLPPGLGRPFKEQQQRWRRPRSRVSRPSTERAEPFWPVEVSLHPWHEEELITTALALAM